MIARNGNGDGTVGRGGGGGRAVAIANRWDVIVQHIEYHSLQVCVYVLWEGLCT
jgi:hypothetical protein